jgi:hypothetical protein
MILNDKYNCTEHIAMKLGSASQWRSGRDVAFPGDPRNLKAAGRLAALADDASFMTDTDWQSLKPHFPWQGERWMVSVCLATREVGFKRHPADFSAFIGNLVSILETQQVSA